MQRFTVELPPELGARVASYAEKLFLSRNRAAALLIEKGIEAEESKRGRLKAIVKDIRSAKNDREAEEKYGNELIELVFGPQRNQ